MKTKLLVAFLVLLVINLIFFGIKYIQIERNIEKYVDSSQEEQIPETSDSQKYKQKLKPKLNEKSPTQRMDDGMINPPQKEAPSSVKNEKKVDPVVPNKTKATVAIIIDDIGVKTMRYFLMEKIPYKLNLAVVPGFKDSKELVQSYADIKKYELLLHMPMEPCLKNGDRESHELKNLKYQYMIRDGQNEKEIRKLLDQALTAVDGRGIIKGLNNHMGSSITASRNMMQSVVKWVARNKMYFVDSMTTAKSVGYEVAKQNKIKTAYNEVFIDGTDDPEYIKQKLEKVKKLAIKNGTVLAIGHIQRQFTLEVLFTEMPKMVNDGIEFVFVSDIL